MVEAPVVTVAGWWVRRWCSVHGGLRADVGIGPYGPARKFAVGADYISARNRYGVFQTLGGSGGWARV